jgi:uncharacterized protein YpmB
MQILTVIFHVIYGSFLKLQTASGKLSEAESAASRKLQEAAEGFPQASESR